MRYLFIQNAIKWCNCSDKIAHSTRTGSDFPEYSKSDISICLGIPPDRLLQQIRYSSRSILIKRNSPILMYRSSQAGRFAIRPSVSSSSSKAIVELHRRAGYRRRHHRCTGHDLCITLFAFAFYTT